MPKMWLGVLFEVNEDRLPKGDAYSSLPDLIDNLVEKSNLGDALTTEVLYLFDEKSLPHAMQSFQASSIDYHHYAVTVRGEKCTDPDCDHFHSPMLFKTDDNKRGDKAPPGVN